jgi:hypothetical protein
MVNIVKNMTGIERTETVNGILSEVNTLDGKRLIGCKK